MVQSTEAARQEIIKDLVTIIKKVMLEKGVNNYKLQFEENAEAGDSFLGEIIFFKIIFANNSKTLNLVMKASNRSEKFRENVGVAESFSREIFTYKNTFPTFQKFISDVNPNFVFNFVPKIHGFCRNENKECLIFDNLLTEGYKLHDKKKPWNLEHSMIVMEYFGKFHAISLALNDQKPEIFKRLTQDLTDDYSEFDFDFEEFYSGHIDKILKLLEDNDKFDLVQKYRAILPEIKSMVTNKTEKGDKLVICHGDGWNDNIMFKYKNGNESQPSNVRFLDFQFSILDSPVSDLVFNIYTTCDKSGLDHFDQLLMKYHASLSQTVKILGSDPDKLFTYDELLTHWKKYAKFGILLSSFVLKHQLATADEIPDMVKAAEDGNIEKCFSFETGNIEEYNRRVLDIFLHFGNRFL